MQKRLLPALLLLAGCQALAAKQAYKEARESLREAPVPLDHGLDARVLPSGLRLAAFQVPGQQDATIWLSLGAGTADEPDRRPGLAQVAVRAAMRAPRGVGGASLLEQLYALGALWSADVLFDETRIGVRCRPERLPQVVAALSALLDDPDAGLTEALVRSAASEQAASLVRAEGGLEAARAAVTRAALEGTPFARGPATLASLGEISLEDARAYLRGAFAPDRSILWLSSGQDAERSAERALSALSGRAAGDPERPVPPAESFAAVPPPERLPRQSLELQGGDREALLMAWVTPGLRFLPAANIGGEALRESIVRSVGRKDLRGQVSHVSVQFLPLDRAGVLLVEVGLEKEADVGRIRDAVLPAAAGAAGLWDWTSPAQVKAWLLRLQLEREHQLSHGWVGPVGRLVRAVEAADFPEWASKNEQAQLGSSVSSWLRAWVAAGPSVMAHLKPAGGLAGDSGAARAEAPQPLPRVDGELTWPTAQSLVAGAVPGADQVQRILQPTGLDAAHSERLPNGLTLVVLPRPGAAYVAVDLALPGGARGVAEGLAARRALRAAEAGLEADGCTMAPSPVAYTDAVVIRSSGPVAWLPAILESAGCWSRPLEKGAARLPTPDEAAGWLVLDAVLQGRPVQLPAGGPDWARAYLDQLGGSEGAVAVISGDVDPAAVLPRLRTVFGRFERRRTGIAAPPTPGWPMARRAVLLDVPGAVRASARVILRLPDRTSITSMDAEVLSRLVQERTALKLEPSGFTVEPDSAAVGSAAFMGLKVTGPPALLAQAVAEILGDLKKLRGRGPTALETAQATWDVARGLAYRYDTIDGAAAALRTLALDGLPLDGWDQAHQSLSMVDAGVLRALLERSAVGAEGLVIRGDAATQAPLLRKEGVEPEVIAPPAPAQPAGKR